MKHLLVYLMVAVLASVCVAEVDTSEINFSTVQAGNFDQKLRGWVDTLNEDITNAAGLSNIGTGNVYYVDSGVGNDGYVGTSPASAMATVDAAIGLCTADNGDVIFVIQGHAESGTAADLWDADVAGITIVHLGNGTNQGTYTYADTDTTIAIGAANVTVYGGRYLAGISEVVAGIIVEAAGTNFTLIGAVCPEPGTSTYEFDKFIQLTTDSNDVSIIGCTAYSADAAGATSFLDGGAGIVDRITFENNFIYGEYSVAPVFSDQNDLEVRISNNTITNLTSGQYCIEFSNEDATGICADNKLFGDTYGAILASGDMKLSGNKQTITDGQNAIDVPLMIGKVYTMSMTSVVSATTDVIATVAGGAIEIISCFGQVTVIQAGDIGNLSVTLDATAGANYDADFSIVVAAANGMLGDVYTFAAVTNAENAGVAQANENAGYPLSWFCPAGVLTQTTSSTGSTGAIKWYITFRVLDEGVTVTMG